MLKSLSPSSFVSDGLVSTNSISISASLWFTFGLWMISFVMCRRLPGYALRASYAIWTARSTPQQYPYDSASRTVTSPCFHSFPCSFICATSPEVL